MKYTSGQLIARFMLQWKPISKRALVMGKPLWVRVIDSFGIGSNAAQQICREHGMDPDMQVKQRRL